MASAFDQRIVRVTIGFDDGDRVFEGLSIYASGQKYMAALMNTCEFRIFNLTKEQRNYILARTSPLIIQKQPVPVKLDVGRESYGVFRLFEGRVTISGVTQPPDIGVILTSITNNFAIGTITADAFAPITALSVISQRIADNNNKKLDFKATNKLIENFSYSGSAAHQIQELNMIGGVVAFIDNDVLVVLDAGQARGNTVRKINSKTGMVGIPQFTHNGAIVRMMIDNTVQIGDRIEIESEIIPAMNGEYIIQQMFFDVASRDQPFYYTLSCISRDYYLGTL